MYKEVGISSNNVPITLSIWYTERSSPTIVFLPGTMSHPLMYENFLCGLSERGFNIIGIHYLSHGKSPKIKKIIQWKICYIMYMTQQLTE